MPGELPKFLQLYIFDTSNEGINRIKTMTRDGSDENLDEETVRLLIEMLDSHNFLAKILRSAPDIYETNNSEDIPESNEVAGLIFGDMSSTIGQRDVILKLQSRHLQEIRDDHPL